MATLEKIRKRAGILVAVIIGVALFAFILTDMLNSGSSMFSGDRDEIAKVAGKSIPVQLYQQRVDALIENYKRNSQQSSLDEETTDMIREDTWENLIREYVMEDEYDELGIGISPDEMIDMIQGNNIHPQVQRFFTNPNTGIFDRNIVNQYLKSLEQDPQAKADWLVFEEGLVKSRISSKYMNLIKKGLYTTLEEAKDEYLAQNQFTDFNYLFFDYTLIDDKSVKISEDELQKYYDEHILSFQQETSRDIEYITFDIKPSAEDDQKVKQWINERRIEFEKAENTLDFVNENTTTPYKDVFYKSGELTQPLDSIIFKADTGFIYGPFFEDNTYKIAKLIDIRYLPDSVKASHILIQPGKQDKDLSSAKARIDSIKNAVLQGADFAELARRLSADQGSAQKGGDLDWFTQGKIVKSFDDSCFFGKKGDLKVVETQSGVHLILITDQTAPLKKIKIAFVDKPLDPSDATIEKIYSVASKFASTNNTKEKFYKAIADQGLTKRIASNIIETARNVSDMKAPRELVRWVYNAKKDDVSPVIELSDRYVVAVLVTVREKGNAPLDQVKDKVEVYVRKKKKAEQYADRINKELPKNQSFEQLSAALGKEIKMVNDVNFASFSIPGLVAEPYLIGVAANMEKDKISKPIEGTNGVFVVRVSSIRKAPEGDYSMTKQNLDLNIQSQADYRVYNALKEKANIFDNRARFY